MNVLRTALESPAATRLGWTLLHVVWQGVAVAALLRLALALMRNRSAAARYVASCAALAVLAALPVVTYFAVPSPARPTSAKAVAAAGAAGLPSVAASKSRQIASLSTPAMPAVTSAAAMNTLTPQPTPPAPPLATSRWTRLLERTRDVLPPALPWLVSIYAIGVVILSLWNLGGWLAVRRLRTRDTALAAPEWNAAAARLAARLGLHRPVRLLTSVRVAVPMVVGALRPVVLLPVSVLTGLAPAEVESLLAHELAHVRRHDYLVNLAQCVVETLLFYHPAVWWVSRRMRVEREHCCDDLAVAVTGDRANYVRALAAVASVSAVSPRLAPAATGGALLARVRRLLGLPDADAARGSRWLAGAVALAICALAITGVATRAQDKPPAKDKDFDAPKTYAVDVEVVDKTTGEPLANVPLKVRVDSLPRSYTTDATGHAHVEYGDQTKYLSVTAEPPKYVPRQQTWTNRPDRDPIPPTQKLELERGTVIGGLVTDVAGRPITGVKMDIYLQDKNDPRTETQNFYARFGAETDADGRWRCDTIPSEILHVTFRLSHPDYAADVGFGRPVNPSLADLRAMKGKLTMTKGFQVGGRVLDDQGKPIAGAGVVIGGRQYNSHAPEAKSDADGHFVLKNCQRDPKASVLFTAPKRSPELKEVVIDRDRDDVEVRLQPGRVLRVRITDPAGQPLAGARLMSRTWRGVDAPGWTGKSDTAGWIIWTEAPAEPINFGVYAPGHIQLLDTILTATGNDQVVTLLPALKVSGTVVDDANGQPVENFRVVKGWASGRREAPSWERRGSREEGIKITPGKFDYVEDVERDGYATRIEADGYLPAESRIMKGEEGAVALSFRLKKGAPLTGTLVTPAGKPLAGAHLLLVNASSQIIVHNGEPTSQTYTLKAKSDDAGHFSMAPQVGQFTLMVLHPDGYAELTPEQLATPGKYTIQPWGRVEGIVRVGAKPGAGQVVVANPVNRWRGERPMTLECNATADAQGRFVLPFVVPGDAGVAMEVKTSETKRSAGYGYAQRQHVTAAPGETARVEIGGKGRPVTGRLVAPPEAVGTLDWAYAHTGISTKLVYPKQDLPAEWQNMDAPARQAWQKAQSQRPEMQAFQKAQEARLYFPVRVGSDGTFRVDDVPAGTYELTVSLQAPPDVDPVGPGPTIASGRQEFTIPPMPTGRSDDPLALDDVVLTPVKPVPAPGR